MIIVNPLARLIIVASVFAVVAPLACNDASQIAGVSDGAKALGPQHRGLSPTVVVDTFSVGLDAQPGTTVAMHNYSDVVYAEVRVEDTIHLKTEPPNPPNPGPVNNTNGPVYAYGSFVSGGNCGLYVTISYPAIGLSKRAAPCDQHHRWVDTVLVKGAGSAIRGPSITELPGSCITEPCHSQWGSQAVIISAIPVKLVVTTDSGRFIRKNQPVKFTVSANPNNMTPTIGGGGTPRRVTGWHWQRADTSVHTSDTTKIGLYCSSMTATTCQLPIQESGFMIVDAVVNGTAQTEKVPIVIVPCPTKDSLIDNPVHRLGMTVSLDSGNANSPNKDIRKERQVIFFDSAGVTVLRLSPSDTRSSPCWNYDSPSSMPGTVTVMEHSHPFSIGDSLPAICTPPGAKPNEYVSYGHGYGGLSGADWRSAWNNQLPMVVPDLDSVYRIYPHPVDSFQLLPDTTWHFFPTNGWQQKVKSAPRVFGACTLY